MKFMSVGFVLSAFLTLALAASLEETETNDNEEVVSKCSNTMHIILYVDPVYTCFTRCSLL